MSTSTSLREAMESATCIYTQTQVEQALDQMAAGLTACLENANPVFLGVMVGAVIPLGCLLPRLNFLLEVDYLHATRYQGGTRGKALVWKRKPSVSLQSRTVVVVDDVLDEGATLADVAKYCQDEGADKVYKAVLVDKTGNRAPNGLPEADFTGLKVVDGYLFGYGMDYKEYGRNAAGIFQVADDYI